MPEQQWRIRVQGAMRKDLSVDLLVQAVMALGEQLQHEQRERDRAAEAREVPSCQPETEQEATQ